MVQSFVAYRMSVPDIICPATYSPESCEEESSSLQQSLIAKGNVDFFVDIELEECPDRFEQLIKGNYHVSTAGGYIKVDQSTEDVIACNNGDATLNFTVNSGSNEQHFSLSGSDASLSQLSVVNCVVGAIYLGDANGDDIGDLIIKADGDNCVEREDKGLPRLCSASLSVLLGKANDSTPVVPVYKPNKTIDECSYDSIDPYKGSGGCGGL